MSEKTPSEILDCAGIIDSHAHYFDKRFDAESDGACAILSRDVFGRGISAVINVGTRNETNLLAISQAAKYENMFAAIGIHPEDVQMPDIDLDTELSSLSSLLKNAEERKKNKIVALGEIGLDYHWQPVNKPLQQRCFDAQMELAKETGLPVIIHDREAHGDCFETVLRYPNVRGVFHSYSGSPEMALELVKRGWFISFSGVLTFKNARKTVESAAAIPLDRILIETDAPYLAPTGFRGSLNHSGLMGITAKTLADIKGISVNEAICATADNTRRLFNI
jgi:TatD DNase family protein